MKFSIRQQLLFAFLAMLLLGVLVALAALYQLGEMNAALSKQQDAAQIYLSAKLVLWTLLAGMLTLGSLLTLLMHRTVVHGLEHLLSQLNELALEVKSGRLETRINTTQLNDFWTGFATQINTLLDNLIEPINVETVALKKMADGQLTIRIAEEFRGDHNVIKNALNKVADVAADALLEFDELIVSFDAGNFDKRIDEQRYYGDWLRMMQGVNSILASVHRTTLQVKEQNWIKTGLAELTLKIRGDMLIDDLARVIVKTLSRYTDAQVGALYDWHHEDGTLHLVGSYAFEKRKGLANRFALGEGLVGQAALEKQLISVTQLPDDYTSIVSGIGYTLPRNILVLPLLYESELMGVLELGRVREFDPLTLELLHTASGLIGIAIYAAQSNTQTQALLKETKQQAAQLQLQQAELQQSNEELEEQAQSLRANEENLRLQQHHLKRTNEELADRTAKLEQQGVEVAHKNSRLELARINLEQQAADLALASKYKSEFLANMSHELRTPLNSMLLLSRSLTDNRTGNMTEKQVKAATVMHQSGNDLLCIINDILDLSKIEAGHEIAVMGNIELKEFVRRIDSLYQPVAEDKGLSFQITADAKLPAQLNSDQQRLGQILRNLLSNAFKFTHQGGVTLSIAPAASATKFQGKLVPGQVIAFAVSDTGRGIPQEKQKQIWEAFQQADGSTSREYGGTGLGLTISRELAQLLGGEIQLSSEVDSGSTFTLYLPMDGVAPCQRVDTIAHPAIQIPEHIMDDRETLTKDEEAILIVEDDPIFAQILAGACREHGMKYLAASSAEQAMELLHTCKIGSVLLDMTLPEQDGWSVLARIKEELDTLHIPVYVISSDEKSRQAMLHGAMGFLQKPVSPEQLQQAFLKISSALGQPVKSILLIEDDPALQNAVKALLSSEGVSIETAGDGAGALLALKRCQPDLIVLDLGLPDISGFDLLDKMRNHEGVMLPPVIIFTGRDLSLEEYEKLQRYSANVIIKGVRSDERLIEEVARFLHRRVDSLPLHARNMMATLRDRDALFTDKQVLLVDDDIRNIFSLSGLLEDRGCRVLTARNGAEALELLSRHPDIDLLLTDIMMPGMDGYELIRKVRAQKRHTRLPILALTAKAMKDDRTLCLAAGASDYLSKPIDIDRLFAMMRVWLYR
jgi:CheY-like chemotaxis protein/signal transduction histidine kinase